jgi:glycerophosphoryl diester phosphodiesterase
MPRPLLIAHRGASATAPENTLAAFALAAAQGAEAIETDLRLSRDAQFVCFHDARLSRTTDGRGWLSHWPLERLRRLDAGAWFAPQYAGQRIPLLTEVLELARQYHLALFLELKTRLSSQQLHALLTLLAPFPRQRLCVLAFRAETLRYLHRMDPAFPTGLLVERSARAVRQACAVGARLLAVRHRAFHQRLLTQAKTAGLEVVVWTVNDPAVARRLAAAGVDGIMTDDPKRLAAVIGAPMQPR